MAAFIAINSSAVVRELPKDDYVLTGDIPEGLTFEKTVKLKNANLTTSIIFTEPNPTLEIEGDCIIKVRDHTQCIDAREILTIKGAGSLRLECVKRSSAIGLGAKSQSYNRYVPKKQTPSLDKITVDGVQVEVECATPNFSMGVYGIDNAISVACTNGGSIIGCPEATNQVRLENVGITSDGSTKIEGDAEYVLASPDDSTFTKSTKF